MIKIIKQFDWSTVKLAALTTKGLNAKTMQPSDDWIKNALISEHSILQFTECKIDAEMMYKTAVHLKVHNKKDGFYMLMQSQREDWTGKDRNPNEIIKTVITATPKSIIEISRQRLCSCAANHTVNTWLKILSAINNPIIRKLCVPNCVYRGFCPEKFNSCGYANTQAFKETREEYLNYCRGE